MKTIRRTIPERIITRYKCEACGTSYRNKKAALRCDAKPIEKKLFKIGELVRCKVVHTCTRHPRDFNFNPVGKVSRILGPQLTDCEYEAKWMGGYHNRRNSHVWLYQVESRCPRCHDKRSGRFYGPEFTAVKKKSGMEVLREQQAKLRA